MAEGLPINYTQRLGSLGGEPLRLMHTCVRPYRTRIYVLISKHSAAMLQLKCDTVICFQLIHCITVALK